MYHGKIVGLNERAKQRIAECGKPHYSGKHIHMKVAGKSCDNVFEIKVPEVEECVTRASLEEGRDAPYGDILHQYHLRDGTRYIESVQEERYGGVEWSGGYYLFLALKDAQGNIIPETLWTEEEIQKHL